MEDSGNVLEIPMVYNVCRGKSAAALAAALAGSGDRNVYCWCMPEPRRSTASGAPRFNYRGSIGGEGDTNIVKLAAVYRSGLLWLWRKSVLQTGRGCRNGSGDGKADRQFRYGFLPPAVLNENA